MRGGHPVPRKNLYPTGAYEAAIDGGSSLGWNLSYAEARRRAIDEATTRNVVVRILLLGKGTKTEVERISA